MTAHDEAPVDIFDRLKARAADIAASSRRLTLDEAELAILYVLLAVRRETEMETLDRLEQRLRAVVRP